MELINLLPLSQGELQGLYERFLDGLFAASLPALKSGDDIDLKAERCRSRRRLCRGCAARGRETARDLVAACITAVLRKYSSSTREQA
ncbi:MAG: hypothetical protein PVJ83_04355, partial [Gammaproteobacteria bacterium]